MPVYHDRTCDAAITRTAHEFTTRRVDVRSRAAPCDDAVPINKEPSLGGTILDIFQPRRTRCGVLFELIGRGWKVCGTASFVGATLENFLFCTLFKANATHARRTSNAQTPLCAALRAESRFCCRRFASESGPLFSFSHRSCSLLGVFPVSGSIRILGPGRCFCCV